jgi:hypothetical protein
VSRRRLILYVSLGIAVFLIAFSLLSSNPHNDAQETQTLQIFLDQNLSTPYRGQSPILWGTVRPGVVNFTIWLRNDGAVSLENLLLVPPLSPFNLTLTWDLDGYTLKPHEVKKATLTLTVPPSSDLEKTLRFLGRFYIAYVKKE